jgi:hypothetical protein
MTIVRQVLSAWVSQLHVLIVLVVLFELGDSPPIIFVNAFTSIFTGTKLGHSTFRCTLSQQHRTHTETSITGLWIHDRQIEIRDWQLTDNEPQKIFDLLLQREKVERKAAWNFFDPEGSLDLDVLNELRLEESYSKQDGGCFLVAVNGEYSENDDDENIGIVGTLGMISGTQISYQPSGSSFSKPEITAAIRRVCASRVDDDDDDPTNETLTKNSSATKILEALIRQGEQRAIESGATNMIGLAYSEVATVENIIAKPTVSIFESLGYRVSQQQIPGVTTIQYEKELSENQLIPETNTEVDSTAKTTQEGEWIIPAAVATIFSLGFLVFKLYSTVFGIEQLWGSVDNGGIGTSLSTQNLEELIRNEKLGRSGLDDDIGSDTTRQWEDLSPEELREEQALMKVIQGQYIRTK